MLTNAIAVSLLAPEANVGDLLVQGGALSMGQIMQRLLEGVQAELQAEERDLCAHLNAQAHLLILEAHLNCLEGSGSGFEGPDAAGFDGTGSGKGKQGASATDSPDEPVMSDSTVRGKRRLSAGDTLAVLPHMVCSRGPMVFQAAKMSIAVSSSACAALLLAFPGKYRPF